MSSLSATRRQEQRKRLRRRLWFWFFMLAVGGAGAAGYFYGQEQFVSQEAGLRAEIETLKQAQNDLITGLAQVQATADQAQADLAALEQAYDRDVPTGALQELSALTAQRLRDGVSEDRLRFVLSQVNDDTNCDGIDVKRFRPQTRLTPADSADDAVSFADGAIQITGRGEPDRDDEGNPVSWYDPTQPVDIQINLLDGRSIPVTGTLPLREQAVSGADEHRVIVSAGPRSFMLVTYQRCPFP